MKDQADNVTNDLELPAPLSAPDNARPEGVRLVRLADVEARPQVRESSGMDDESLRELGESIIRDGLLQFPLLRETAAEGKLVIVSGHRRIEAMRRVGFESCYAIVGTVGDHEASMMQLAENIHREQLSVQEVAKALRALSDNGWSLSAIALRVGKSKPWVSKHLAVTHPQFGSYARKQFEECKVEDLEILNSLSQAEKHADAAKPQGLSGFNWLCGRYPYKGWTRKTAAAAAKEAKALGSTDEANGEQEEVEEDKNDAQTDKNKGKERPSLERELSMVLEVAADLVERGEYTSWQQACTYLVEALCERAGGLPKEKMKAIKAKLAGDE